MLKFIFLSAIRSLLKYKHISLINLFGLVLGITSFLFIQHYLLYEFSFDHFIKDSEQVYRINFRIDKEGQTIYNGAKTPRAIYFALKNDIPEIEANSVAYFEKCLVRFEENSLANQDVLWVEEDFERVFPLEMVEGYADYSKPRLGTISETAAKTFFGDKSPIGEIIGINQGMPIEITGVFKDLPSNTHFSAQYFASVKTWVEMEAISAAGDWRWNGWWSYIRLKDGVSPHHVTDKINTFIDTYMGFLQEDNRQGTFSLQPLHDLHFISGIEGEMGAQTNRSSLSNLMAIALITILIAWINYVNLAMAHAQSRALQIKMRKLIGASNTHLWHQSLAESVILNVTALIISVAFYLIFLNSFARIFFIPINQADLPLSYMVIVSLAIIVTGIIFSSLYHGIALSKITIVATHTKSGRKFKNWLVLVQMIVSTFFLTSTIIVYQQISFMKTKNLGIELDDVIILTGPASLNADGYKRERFESFKRELLTFPDFKDATFNMYVPGQEPARGYREFTNPASGISPDVFFFENNASAGFINTYQMQLLAGRDFTIEPYHNSNQIVINEAAMQHLGFANPEDAISRQIYHKGSNQQHMEIVGVVANFHNEGLQKPIYPIIWNNHYPNEFGYFAVRVQSNNAQKSLDLLRIIWNKHYTQDNFDYIFAKEQFNLQYQSESRFGKFYLWLTILSIGIATIGLYGLIVFTFHKRTREISIRKVNGAKVIEIMLLLGKDFMLWVGLAFLVATPLSFFAMNKWLQNFAYRIDVYWWIFALAGIIMMCITMLTVSWQSYKIATRNPAETLRYE